MDMTWEVHNLHKFMGCYIDIRNITYVCTALLDLNLNLRAVKSNIIL